MAARKKKNAKKNSRGKPLVLPLLAALVVFLFLASFHHFPATSPASGFLEKVPVLKNLKTNSIQCNAWGDCNIKRAELSGPFPIIFNDISLRLNLSKLLSGKVVQFKSIQIGTMQIDLDSIDENDLPSFQNDILVLIKNGHLHPECKIHVEQLLGNYRNHKLLAESGNLSLNNTNTALEIKLNHLNLGKFPGIQNFKTVFIPEKGKYQLKKGSFRLLSGNVLFDKAVFFPGTENFIIQTSFDGFSLKNLTSRFDSDNILMGNVSGKGTITGKVSRPEARFQGEIRASKVRVEKWDFQQSLYITSYMPDLKSLSFNTIKISEFIWKNNRLTIPVILAKGNPLSFTGSAHSNARNQLSLDLNCILEKPFCKNLKPLVRSGLRNEKNEGCGFNCNITGDYEKQVLTVKGKIYKRAIKAQLNKFGKTILKLFD